MLRNYLTNKRSVIVYITVSVMVLMFGLSTRDCRAGVSDDSNSQSEGGLVRIKTPPRADDPFKDVSFPTIYKSGIDLCTNIGGQPVVFLITSSTCPHCKWLGEIFDVVVKDYMDEGKIEAHHYDTQTGDDLFTEEVETEIPEEILEIFHHGSPKDLVPYINFSCKYERVGTGNEKTQDTETEGKEIMEVIDTLIEKLSTK